MAFYLMHEGSVKDFYVQHDPTDNKFGTGHFLFKKRPDGTGPLSIFDLKNRFPYGIKGKAEAMHDESVHFFELMDEHNIQTHFTGSADDYKMNVLVAHIPPEDDYVNWMINRGRKPSLVPAEVVVTDIVRPISSLHKDLRSGKKKPEQYGLDRVPNDGETVFLDEPVIRESTKLEKLDVYEDGLLEDVGFNGGKRSELRSLAINAFGFSKKDAEQAGLRLVDGKFEFLLGPDGEFYIGDTFLTSDENRLLAQSITGEWIDISKQLPRDLHTITGYREILEEAQNSGVPFDEWPIPEPLEDFAMRAVEKSYAVLHQQLCRKPMGLVLDDVATTAEFALQRYMERYKRDIMGKPFNVTEV